MLKLETYLNSSAFKGEFPENGEDVKVMGLRRNRNLDLTVAMPLLAAHISSEQAYSERKVCRRPAAGEFPVCRSRRAAKPPVWKNRTGSFINTLAGYA